MIHERNVSLGENLTLLGYYTVSSGNVSLLPFSVCGRYHY